MNGEKLIVFRPRLAVALIARGCPFEVLPHPWRAGWSSWAFEVTDTVIETAAPFYAELGKPLPKCLRREGSE